MYINVWTFLEKKESSALVFSKLFTPKEVVTQMHEKSYLSKHLSSHPTHVLRNAVLSFHLFHFESNWVRETRFYWHLILEDSLVNTLIMDENNFYVKRENHGYHWNEVIWKTNFCCNFVKFLNCTLNFEYFEEKKKKKNEPRRFSIFQIIHSEKRDYLSAWNVLFVKILCSHLAHVWRKAHLV